MSLMSELEDLGELLATNISAKGVTASASDGLTTLAGKISQIQTGSGGGASNIITGTFTTGSTGGSTGTINLNYTGSGYPIACLIFIADGLSDTDTNWYTTIARYAVGWVLMVKAVTSTAPTYKASGSENYGAISYLYKSNTTSATTYSRTGNQTANTYTVSSANASSGVHMIRFQANAKTLSYYVGNPGSSYGLAMNTTFRYIVFYSS